MLRFGVLDREKYRRLSPNRRVAGSHVALTLLETQEPPSAADIADFEDVCFALRLSNRTFRTSFRNRFPDVNARIGAILESSFDRQEALRIEDRAVSHGLTAFEWASEILVKFPLATFEASDLILDLRALTTPDGTTFVTESDGTPLQAISSPWVVSICHREPRRYPLNHLLSWWYRRRWARLALPTGWPDRDSVGECRVRKIPFVHPEARALARTEPRFQVVCRSAFDVSAEPCHAVRTMNIFIRSYFSADMLRQGCDGFWVLGRTTEGNFQNHASILRRGEKQWELVERIGQGADVEDLVLQYVAGPSAG